MILYVLELLLIESFEEASYTLVTTAWEDRFDSLLAEERERIEALDIPFEENEKEIIFYTKTLKLVLSKSPLHFLYINQMEKSYTVILQIELLNVIN